MESPVPHPIRRPNSQLEHRHWSRGPLENGGLDPSAALSRGIAFVGRLGGNLAFTASEDHPDYHKTMPDARPFFTWAESFHLRPFLELDLWHQAIIEGWATCMLVFLSGTTAYSLASKSPDFASGPLVPAVIGALSGGLGLALFIFTTGPVSGGHLNPLITISTFFGGLATFPRTVLYILFQVAGATVAGFLIRAAGVVPPDFNNSSVPIIPGCTMEPSFSSAEAYVLETLSCLTILHYAFGIGLDPRQKVIYGPALGPILIGLALAICVFATAFVRDGYTGASMNPARCFGLMAALGGNAWHGHWVHWVGGLTASLIHSGFYLVIPPSKKRKM